MDEQTPSPSSLFGIPNIPNSAPYYSRPISHDQPTQDQIISSSDDHMLRWCNNLLCGSTSSFDIHNKPLALPSDDQSLTAKNIVSELLVDKNNGGEIIDKARVARKRKSAPQRIAFHTRSDDDVLDDGYRWRKYGQKTVKNNPHPRSYYRCSHHTCSVKKQIQRLSKDSSIVVTTYEGVHNHPCESLMESLSPLLKQLEFFVRI